MHSIRINPSDWNQNKPETRRFQAEAQPGSAATLRSINSNDIYHFKCHVLRQTDCYRRLSHRRKHNHFNENRSMTTSYKRTKLPKALRSLRSNCQELLTILVIFSWIPIALWLSNVPSA